MKSIKEILKELKEKKDWSYWDYDFSPEWSLSVEKDFNGVHIELYGKGKREKQYIGLIVDNQLGFLSYRDRNLSKEPIEYYRFYDKTGLSFCDGVPAINVVEKPATEKEILYYLNEGLRKLSNIIPYEKIDDYELIKYP